MIKYIPGLNGIRAIAVLFVIISHRFPKDHVIHFFPLGNYGVDIFFVLSGFLISRSLFFKIKENEKGLQFIDIKNFFVRRFLRIFPVYYALLFFMFLTGGIVGNLFREHVLWYVFYIANYLNYYQNKWFGALAHFWSLSVEEQFYLFLPILLLVFRKRIFYLICIFILVGTVYPFFIKGMASVLTLSCVNAFGIGALLAYIEIMRPDFKGLFIKILKIVFLPVLLLIGLCRLDLMPLNLERLFISIVAVTLMTYCRFKSCNYLMIRILENRVLNFIGMISYGIYLFHNVVPKYWVWLLRRIGWKTPATIYEFSYVEVFLQTLFIIGISYLSWMLLEKPVLKFKSNFK